MKLHEAAQRISSVVLGLILSAGIVTAQEQSHKGGTEYPFLWRIEGQGDRNFKVKSWMYGTMHLGDKRLVTLCKAVNDARDSADALYCELDMVAMNRDALKIAKKMLLPKGQRRRDQISPKLYSRLASYLTRHGSSIKNFDRMRLWAVNLNLATLDIAKMGYTHSLDQMIYKDARNDGLEVGGLETMDEQLHALASFSEADSIAALEQALDIAAEYDAQGRSQLGEMLEVYLSGDAAKLVAKVKEQEDRNPELTRRMMKPMLDDRNVRMADRMAAKLTAHPGKSYFFAIGAMHYPGEMGLLKLMKDKGYRVTRINPPPAPSTDLTTQVQALQGRIEKLSEALSKAGRERAALEIKVRKLESQVKALEKQLR